MKQFTRKIEDFVCAHCGTTVVGNGYTNHCPHCLWSRHVDNNPGDRASTCHGMMEPVGVQYVAGKYIITHKCETCGKEIRQHCAENDNIDAIIAISNDTSFIFGGRRNK